MDDGPAYISFFVLLSLILLNGFFSMSEMAIVSSRKARLKAKAEEGRVGYRRALHAAETPARYLSTIQIGITLIGILSGAFGGTTFARPLGKVLSTLPVVGRYSEALALGTVVLTITVLSIVLGELTPKQFALSRPERIAAFAVPILEVIAFAFRPVVSFLSRATSFILKILRVTGSSDQAITEEEIRGALMEGERHGIVEKSERSMVEGVFYLGDRPVETFMTHRSDLTWIEQDADPDTVRAAVLSAPDQTTFPVAAEDVDDVIGVVSAREVLAAFLEGTYAGLKPLIRKPAFVPSTMSALKAFEIFRLDGSETLLVIDEYGGLAGSISVRDLVEEIVGELSAPGAEDEEIVKREDGSYLLGGLLNVDEFTELFGLEKAIPEHREYHTLAGLILDVLGVIPRTGETFSWNGFRFEIVDMDGNRIDKVLVVPPKPESSDGEL